ncbi:MAG: hypothetical protein L6R41_004755 [Letrouitia leprolyta]|nr:MAG: hypothetical protein L6R41_004755 [Letrouitia leprolyta]
MISGYSGSAGTLGLSPFISIPNIPPIITEWSALVPLASHLANHDDEHRLVGELALAGHLKVGLFPRLGYLHAISRLLEGVSDFCDRVNAKSASSYKIWDVNWGSVFTRANGAAASIITDWALSKRPKIVNMPEKVLADPGELPGGILIDTPLQNNHEKVTIKPVFSRRQELHVIRVNRTGCVRGKQNSVLKAAACRLPSLAYWISLLGIIVTLCLLGAFGSAAIVFNGVLSKLVCRLLRTKRPNGYLENNENHEACMLSAVHENASTWCLYIGDRGVIDWLLNKTMLATPAATRMHMAYFRFAHMVQLLAMTFVAAQKGIDGISLVILLVLYYVAQYLLGDHRTARKWLRRECVSVDAHTFAFSGRTPMIGAIHMLSEARDAAWMETLIVPCPRIAVWLDELKCTAAMQSQLAERMQALSPSDKSWVLLNTQLAVQASRMIRQELSQGKARE